MSDLTAASAALLRSWTEPNAEQLAERSAWTRDWLALRIPEIEAEAAARAVDEALSVERVAEALIFLTPTKDHGQLCPVWVRRSEVLSKAPQSHAQRRGPIVCDCFVRRGAPLAAAALVAHLRGPRP